MIEKIIGRYGSLQAHSLKKLFMYASIAVFFCSAGVRGNNISLYMCSLSATSFSYAFQPHKLMANTGRDQSNVWCETVRFGWASRDSNNPHRVSDELPRWHLCWPTWEEREKIYSKSDFAAEDVVVVIGREKNGEEGFGDGVGNSVTPLSVACRRPVH